jgi:hypothetical protein
LDVSHRDDRSINCQFLSSKIEPLGFESGIGSNFRVSNLGCVFFAVGMGEFNDGRSLVGSVVNTATSGFQAIMGTATAALGAKAINNQVVATAEAAAAAVRREIGSAIDPGTIRDNIEDYLEMLRPPN